MCTVEAVYIDPRFILKNNNDDRYEKNDETKNYKHQYAMSALLRFDLQNIELEKKIGDIRMFNLFSLLTVM